MEFSNCVISGGDAHNTNRLMYTPAGAEGGHIQFRKCTFADARLVYNLWNLDAASMLSISDSIITRIAEQFFIIPGPEELSLAQLDFHDNVYSDGLGIYYNGLTYGEGQWTEYQSVTGLESGSRWFDPALQGHLGLEIPEDSSLLDSGTGAVLPASVWDLYERTRREYPTPAGIRKTEP